MELEFSITELSNLTGKSRPTLYKYIQCYENEDLDSIPFSFIKLLDMMVKKKASRKEIVKYCNENFKETSKDENFNDFVRYLNMNKERIDINKLKIYIEEEMNNEK